MPLEHYQAQINGFTFGKQAGGITIESGGVAGLGTPPVRAFDQELLGHGAWAGYDYYNPRVLAFPLIVEGQDAGAAVAAFNTLKAAWGLGDTAIDVCLDGLGPTDDTLRFYGRPRPIEADLAGVSQGLILCLATFDALDPFGYGPEVAVALTGSVNNTGTAAAGRWRAVIAGATNPKITHPNGLFVDLSADGGFSGDVTITRGPMERSVIAAGVNRYSKLTPTSEFFELAPGAQTLTYTGGGTCSFTFRSAWK